MVRRFEAIKQGQLGVSAPTICHLAPFGVLDTLCPTPCDRKERMKIDVGWKRGCGMQATGCERLRVTRRSVWGALNEKSPITPQLRNAAMGGALAAAAGSSRFVQNSLRRCRSDMLRLVFQTQPQSARNVLSRFQDHFCAKPCPGGRDFRSRLSVRAWQKWRKTRIFSAAVSLYFALFRFISLYIAWRGVGREKAPSSQSPNNREAPNPKLQANGQNRDVLGVKTSDSSAFARLCPPFRGRENRRYRSLACLRIGDGKVVENAAWVSLSQHDI
jgi:hypothetical protein